MKALFCIVIIGVYLASSLEVIAQVKTIRVKCQFVSSTPEIAKQFKSLLFSVDAIASDVPPDANGLFYAVIKDNAATFKVALINAPNYKIVYPRNGNANTPKFSEGIVDIIVEPNQDKKIVEGLMGVRKNMEEMKRVLNAASSSASNQNEYLEARLDSIAVSLQNMYSLNDKELKSASEMLKGREEVFPTIDTTLGVYINSFYNLLESLSKNIPLAIQNINEARISINTALTVCGNAYGELNRVHHSLSGDIKIYWKSDELAKSYDRITAIALHDVHENYWKRFSAIKTQLNRLMLRKEHEDAAEKLRNWKDDYNYEEMTDKVAYLEREYQSLMTSLKSQSLLKN